MNKLAMKSRILFLESKDGLTGPARIPLAGQPLAARPEPSLVVCGAAAVGCSRRQ